MLIVAACLSGVYSMSNTLNHFRKEARNCRAGIRGLQTQTVQGLRLAAVRHISSCVTKPPFIYCFSFSSPLFVRMDLFYSGERQP
ncbi:hypothetical protein T4D_2227 [Trichinella pseudospiralis]|uniref:Uncharacterized protein n=1 Tax=Trichinella pseudospiralis TaxID=6337 RepID=A0A0V1FR99_TRIPS|nr:hypothetical protein T4D_2227 [Trichinella pseudospiralis]